MPTTLTTHAVEKSTFVITVAFQDEQGNSVTPNELTWTLTDMNGNVINNRDQVSITPASSVDIVLSGDDLALEGDAPELRVLTVEGTYSSDLGSDLPIKDSVRFIVDNLVAVS
ncbi:MAG TPA: hypothetical protein ENG51_07620 [Deltaproteobacteria bacterium]|nr:hypothetical protein [Deltaproteobacteria bacterium]